MKMRITRNFLVIYAMKRFLKIGLFTGTFILLAADLAIADQPTFDLSIKGHQFLPNSLTIPQGVKVRLRISNLDQTAEEFESFELHREKIVPPGETVPMSIGPLEAGSYKFFGDFHQDSAKGVLIVK